MQKTKFELYVERTFSQKLSATFDFLSENGKVILKPFACLLLPVGAVQALGFNAYSNSIMSAVMDGVAADHADFFGIIFGFLGYVLAMMVGMVLCMSLIFSLIEIYGQRKERLAGITMSDVRLPLTGNIWRMLKIMLSMMLVILLAVAVLVIIVYMMKDVMGKGSGQVSVALALIFVLYIALIVFMLPLSLALPAYILEKDLGVWEAMRKALRLGFKTWGGVFAVTFVLGFIGNFIHGVSFFPWYIMQIVKVVLVSSGDAVDIVTSPVYTFVMYLLGVLQSFCMYIGMAISCIGLAVQYGHAVEKIDGVPAEHDVDDFEQTDDADA